MGNCAPKATPKPKPRPSRSPPPPPPSKPASSDVRLYGSESCPITSRLHLALLYKSVPFQFVPRDSVPLDGPFLQCGAETVSGAADTLLREVDSMFPQTPAAAAANATVAEEVALATALQHRSMERHVEELARWAAEMAASVGDRGRGEAALMGRRYGQLGEVVLEHAQMEERLLFPAIEDLTDQGVCKVANEEHARDLPLINGIKEDIKSMAVMQVGTPCHQEALQNLSTRFKTLEEHFKEHFQEEEKKLLPLLEMVIRTQRELGNGNPSSSSWMEQVVVLMEATHSARLFPFFVAGLLPDEAMQYVGLVCRYTTDQQQLVSMLRSLITYLEDKHT